MQPCDYCGYNTDMSYRIPDEPDRVCSECYHEYMAELAVCDAEYRWEARENR